VISEPSRRRPIVPELLLRRFADDTGRVLMERRDRSRRRVVAVGEAAAESGLYAVLPGGPGGSLEALLDRVEQLASRAIDRVVAGDFPPRAEARGALAVLVALTLVLGRGQRAAITARASLLGQVIESRMPEDVAGEDEAAPAAASDAAVVLLDADPVRVSLGALPRLARLLSARTWQLVRFPRPQLLTGDTPAVLWSRPGAAGPYPAGLGAADEVRVPLDPRHALILARTAPAGEVVRELADRHATALNRTMAELAQQWMYYHPGSDPMAEVELAPP
jgi:hypothetical protein